MNGTDQLAPRISVLRLIVASLMAGVVTFTVVAYLARRFGEFATESNPDFERTLLMVLGLFGLGLLTAYPFLRRQVTGQLSSRSQEPTSEPAEIFRGFQSVTILGAAMAESFALFAAVIYFVTSSQIALVGVAVGLLAISRFFPTEAAFNDFSSAVSGHPSP